MTKLSDAKYMVIQSPESKMKTIVNTETKEQVMTMWFSDVDAIYDDVAKVFLATVGFNFVNLKTGKFLFPTYWFASAQLWDDKGYFTAQVFYKDNWIEIDKNTTIEDLDEQVEIENKIAREEDKNCKWVENDWVEDKENNGKIIEISLPANCELDISEDKRRIAVIVK